MKTRIAKFWTPTNNKKPAESKESKNFDELLKLEKVTDKNAPLLVAAGFATIELIAKAEIKDLVAIATIGDATAESIKAEAIELMKP
jgi:hypothetical protein